MELSPDGTVSIVSIVRLAAGDRTLIGGGRVAAWRPGESRTLKVVCRIAKGGADLTACVDGTKVAYATEGYSAVESIDATGVAGWVPYGSAAGEWSLTSFSRQVPD